jgi:hypothetical protein
MPVFFAFHKSENTWFSSLLLKYLTLVLTLALVACSIIFLRLDLATGPSPISRLVPEAAPAKLEQIKEAYGKLPLSFEANQGQLDEQIKFSLQASGYNLFLTANEMVFSLKQKDTAQAGAVVRMSLPGANLTPFLQGLEELPTRSNFFRGNDPTNWRTNVANYSRVQYQEIYPGIDLVFYGNQQQLEYDFVVAPRVNPASIRLDFQGVDKIELNEQGDLILHTQDSMVVQRAPLVYQQIEGVKQNVTGRYLLSSSGTQTTRSVVSFQIDNYDQDQPLVIDPVLLYSTYLGGSAAELGYAITVDSQGAAYITGQVNAGSYPTLNPFQPALGGGVDAFVAKLNPAGTALVYSTYLGGNNFDVGRSIALDNKGNTYVAGFTASTNFPIQNAFQPAFGGGGLGLPVDAFVAKINSTGNALIYSSYLGGSDDDNGFGIAVDGSGSAYVTGSTRSPNFPTQNALQPTFGGGQDAFITKINPTGNSLIYSTYLGGSNNDGGNGIALDSGGNAYLVGYTLSLNFPTMNAVQPAFGGGWDTFVLKIDTIGTTLVYSTYLGGTAIEAGRGIAVDSSGAAYISGFTQSTDFPVQNALQPNSSGGGSDAFVTKFNPVGGIVYSTYLGGSGYDEGSGIAVDPTGNVYTTGITNSANFPVSNPVQASYGGNNDVFITKLNAAGSALIYSTYLGGSAYEIGINITLDSKDSAYLTGYTLSNNFPTTPGTFQPIFGGGGDDAFIAKIGELPIKEDPNSGSMRTIPDSADLIPQLRETPDRIASNTAENLISYTFTLKNVGAGTASAISLVFPISPSLTLGYATFAHPQAWVSAVTTDSLVISLPMLSRNEIVTGTITFRPNSITPPAPNTKIFTRYRVNYSDPTAGGKQQLSNGVAFSFGETERNQDVSGGAIQLMKPESTSGSIGTQFGCTANFFIPDEIVTAWLTGPDGLSKALNGGKANANGEFGLSVNSTELTSGAYVVAVYGNRSEVTGSTVITIIITN